MGSIYQSTVSKSGACAAFTNKSANPTAFAPFSPISIGADGGFGIRRADAKGLETKRGCDADVTLSCL